MKSALVISAVFGFFAVVLGAFGAHALKDQLDPSQLKSFETGVRYMMYHSIALLFLNTYEGFSSSDKKIMNYLFISGIVCFSGSIFLLSSNLISSEFIWFITPIGGFLFILGWIKMVFTFLKK